MAPRRRSITRRFERASKNLADRLRPELVLISAGFDAHAEDPVGDLGLEIEDFEILTREIVAVAETHAEGRIVSMLEGGYNVPILAGSVAAHLDALGAGPRRVSLPSPRQRSRSDHVLPRSEMTPTGFEPVLHA